jgi:hypothetical protein
MVHNSENIRLPEVLPPDKHPKQESSNNIVDTFEDVLKHKIYWYIVYKLNKVYDIA